MTEKIVRKIQLASKCGTNRIDVVYGSRTPIELVFSGAEFTAPIVCKCYARNTAKDSPTFKADCTLVNNILSIDPLPGFFTPGFNDLQVEISESGKDFITFLIPVFCEISLSDDPTEQPDSVKPYVLQAQEAAKQAAKSATAAQQAAAEAAASAEKAEAAALKTYKHYIARWDKTTAQLTRLGDAVGITTDTTKFCYRGSDTGDYDNPFDGIYPWSHRRLCNVDLDAYRALEAGASLRGCVSAWEGEPGFSYDDPSGVWVYTPEFWGDAWEDGAYRYYEVADREVAGLIHYPESIGGRWHGAVAQITVGGAQKTGFLPLPGMPGKRIAISTLHSYAKNGGFTLENIFVYDASSLLYLVEYGNFHSQSALGSGVSDLYTEAEDKFTDAASESITVSIQASRAGNVIPGAIFDIGTSKGGKQVGSFTVVSKETDPDDSTKAIITLDSAATVTADNYWSIHGLVNTKDEQIGSRSGYIGTNGKSHAYYRGEVFFGNIWRYILGAYHQATTNHIFLAKSESEADLYDAINTTNHIDSGIEIAASNGYIKSLGFKRAKGALAIPTCTEIGGSSSAPVADYHYNSPGSNTILIAGGRAGYGSGAGRFFGCWDSPASTSSWSCGARPFLNSP